MTTIFMKLKFDAKCNSNIFQYLDNVLYHFAALPTNFRRTTLPY